MTLAHDVWLVFQRQMLLVIRTPIWIAVGVIQPIIYLFLFGPMLKQALVSVGGPDTYADAYTVYVPGLMVSISCFGGIFSGFGLLAELRAEEAFDYLRNVNSGHPGSITSVHATSAELAFEQMVLLVKQNPGGRGLARQDIKSLLYLLIDVVIQFGVEHHQRFVKEIWFDPARKHR